MIRECPSEGLSHGDPCTLVHKRYFSQGSQLAVCHRINRASEDRPAPYQEIPRLILVQTLTIQASLMPNESSGEIPET